ISALMELVNEIYDFCDVRGVKPAGRDDEPPPTIARRETAAVLREAIESVILLISPFTPHLSEELWEQLGHTGGIGRAGWPTFDEAVARAEEIEIPIQVNGKVRTRITVPADADADVIKAAAMAAPGLQPHLASMEIVKVVVANRRLVSVVVRPAKGAPV
ncbi:MAG TPA: class I tRNA ligase family protein, partial [Vicinamibacterales bacterium]|nr:class I tRNA ligase family protein [Vicinamibacterales bacterium]